MQSTPLAVLAFTTFVYFSGMFTTVYGGKCSGRWAIHACYGGNGKRSGPPTDTSISNRQNDKQFNILSQLLLSDRIPSLSRGELSRDEVVADEEPVLDTADTLYPDLEQLERQRNSLIRVKNLLNELLLESKLRSSDDLEYKR